MAAPTIRDIEALEAAIRDYLSLVLEGQAEIKASLEEIKEMIVSSLNESHRVFNMPVWTPVPPTNAPAAPPASVDQPASGTEPGAP